MKEDTRKDLLLESIKELDEIFSKEYGKKPKTREDLAWEKTKGEALRGLPRPPRKRRKKVNTYKG